MDEATKVGRHAARPQEWDDVEAAPPESVETQADPPQDRPAAPESPEQALARKRLAQGFWTLPDEVNPVVKPTPARLVWLVVAGLIAVSVILWAVLR